MRRPCSGDQLAIVWDASTGLEVRTYEQDSSVTSVAFSADSKTFLLGTLGDTASLWDVATGRKLQSFKVKVGWPSPVAFGARDRQIITGSTVWDTTTGKVVSEFKADQRITAFERIAFGLDGPRMLLVNVTAQPAVVTLWDMALMQKRRAFEGYHSCQISADGRRVATAGLENKTVTLWDTSNGKKLRDFEGHLDRPSGLLFSPDGKMIAADSNPDGAVTVWDVATGRITATFKGYRAISGAFSSDGKVIALTSGPSYSDLHLRDAVQGK